MSELYYLEKIQKDIKYSTDCQEEILRVLNRIADALEKPKEDVYLTIEEVRKLNLANQERTQK